MLNPVIKMETSCRLYLGPGFRLGARWSLLGETVKTRKKREKTGKKWARYGLRSVNKEGTGGITCCQTVSQIPSPVAMSTCVRSTGQTVRVAATVTAHAEPLRHPRWPRWSPTPPCRPPCSRRRERRRTGRTVQNTPQVCPNMPKYGQNMVKIP